MYPKIFLFLLFLSICYSVPVEEKWRRFKINFNKYYKSRAEETHAFQVFQNNLNEIEAHNRLYDRNLVSYRKAITKFADLTGQEFEQIYNLHQGSIVEYEYPFKTPSNSTDYVNWKERGAVTKVKDQGICGACWIYSAVGVLEGYHFRKYNKLVTLSEQNMIDCLPGDTCHGGFPPTVIEFLQNKDNGINTEEDYPHKGFKGACRFDKTKKVKLEIKNFTQTACDEEDLMENLEKYGPIAMAISANGDWRLYESGVWFEKKCSYSQNHAILLVGYGTEDGKDYWLVKNSYGKEWGINGYIKIARNTDANYCGIEAFAMYIE